jgi:hypothetical protein
LGEIIAKNRRFGDAFRERKDIKKGK